MVQVQVSKQISTELLLSLDYFWARDNCTVQIGQTFKKICDLLCVKICQSLGSLFKEVFDQVVKEREDPRLGSYFERDRILVDFSDRKNRIDQLSVVQLASISFDCLEHLLVLLSPNNLVARRRVLDALRFVCNFLNQCCWDVRWIAKVLLCYQEHI